MEPFYLFLLFAAGIGILITLVVVFLMGTSANPDGKRIPGTMRFADYSDMVHGGDMKIRHVKYHPTSMHLMTPLEEHPMAHGLVRVIIKEGMFGWRSRPLTWEANRIQTPKNIKGGYGTYCADLLNLETHERLDRLEHENGDLHLKLHESQNTVQVLSRNVNDEVERQVETRIKELQKMLPATAMRRPGTGGGR